MKKYILIITLFLTFSKGYTQLVITPGAQLICTGNADITLDNIDWINNGSFAPGTGSVKFIGLFYKNIAGPTGFYDVEIAKPGTAKITLLNNIVITHQLKFTSGIIDLNQNNITLSNGAFLNNENENSYITGTSGGEVVMTLNMNAPVSMNPGNLGAIITSTSNLGSVTIKRGHKAQAGTGLTGSITRYYNIQPQNNTNLNATLRFQYLNTERNGQNETALEMFRSTDNGASWTNQSFTTRSTADNYVEKTGIPAFSVWTLSSSVTTLPIAGLEFYAKRISNTQVQLDWKTLQEMNNKGFHIERKKENETNFADMGFVNSKALNGNSSLGLTYQQLDNNNFTGNTYYRLKQEDIDGKSTYSVVRTVKGDMTKQLSLQVWPVPAVGFFNVSVNGLSKADLIQVIDMNGRMVKQFTIQNQTQQQVSGLPAGTYFVKLGSDNTVAQKVVLQ